MHTEVEGRLCNVSQHDGQITVPQPGQSFPCYNGLILFRAQLTGVLGFWMLEHIRGRGWQGGAGQISDG